MEQTAERSAQRSGNNGGDDGRMKKMYLRFGAMTLTAMVVMYAVMFVGSYEWNHVRWSESRLSSWPSRWVAPWES